MSKKWWIIITGIFTAVYLLTGNIAVPSYQPDTCNNVPLTYGKHLLTKVKPVASSAKFKIKTRYKGSEVRFYPSYFILDSKPQFNTAPVIRIPETIILCYGVHHHIKQRGPPGILS